MRDIRNAWQNLCERAGLGRFACRGCGELVPGGVSVKTNCRTESCAATYGPQPRIDPARYATLSSESSARSGSAGIGHHGYGRMAHSVDVAPLAIVSGADQRAAVEMLERARAEKAISPTPALIAAESPSAQAASTKAKVQ